ncbi:MAG: prepilin-type N-terminal cleavage/methylation domain-containing protein [Candidatus Gracilibacteria bacterium]|nr:prepilin-type N-terminal cleavage/methylation domain-containing protein [Candidatus Gracilibacteria bacterium]
MKIGNKPIPLSGTSLGKGRNSAFTLVELIIVITILAILATIGFMSFQSYTMDARDANRTTSIKSAQDGLEIYIVKNSIYPSPDNAITLTGGNTTISQGTLGTAVSNAIKLIGGIKDPSTNNYYTYSISGNGNYYQIGADLENAISYNNFANTAYAEQTKAYVKGNYSFDPSLPSLITITGSVNTNSGIFDPNVCFVIDGGTNLVSSSSGTCTSKYKMNLKDYDSSLVGYWDMETYYQSGGLYYLKDLSLNNNDGVFSGGMNPTSLGVILSGGLVFNGTSNYIESNIINNYGANSGSTTISVLGKINYYLSTNHDTFLGNYCGTYINGGYVGYAIKIWGSTKSFEYRNYDVGAIPQSIISFNENTNYFITGKYDSATKLTSIYINGTKISEKTSNNNGIRGLSTCKLRFGRNYGGMGNPDYLHGTINDMKIYNRALSDSEIAQQAKIAGF